MREAAYFFSGACAPKKRVSALKHNKKTETEKTCPGFLLIVFVRSQPRETIAAMTRLSTMNAVPQTFVASASLPS